jgi:16S rRNA (cytosine967-C5)-methyltransferase
MSPAPTARSVALEAIGRVIDEGAYSNRLLPSLLARSGLETRDRAFAMDLAFGTLRRRLPLDAAITVASSRPIERITTTARNALRLGAYQLLDAGVAPHAAVSATVDLVPRRERGFVNAVLRRLASQPPPPPTGTDTEAIAGRSGLAPWAVEELRALVDAEAEEAATALATKAPLSLRARGGDAGVIALLGSFRDAGLEPTVGTVDPDCIVLRGGEPRRLPGFEEGLWTVQDQASAFVVRVLDPQPGERVYDACAAPGGKALHAAELVGPEGRVLAADRSENRVGLIAASGSRLGLDPWLLVQDAANAAVLGPFDRVLVDAPCSGVGSARRRPELLWRVTKERLSGLAALQLAIVGAAADTVRPGGRLVYAVCTFTRAETDAVCDALLRRRPDLEPIETDGPDGTAVRHRLWPHRHGCDAMFVAVFRRAS